MTEYEAREVLREKGRAVFGPRAWVFISADEDDAEKPVEVSVYASRTRDMRGVCVTAYSLTEATRGALGALDAIGGAR